MEATLVHPGESCDHVLHQAGRFASEGPNGPCPRVEGLRLSHASARVPGDREHEGADGVRRHHGGARAMGRGLGPGDPGAEGEGSKPSK